MLIKSLLNFLSKIYKSKKIELRLIYSPPFSCASWSPKGKQIVVGFPNGKLIQFKPDLKPARIIDCPPNTVEGGAFDIIALQWLSTYQFAAVFLSKNQDATPGEFRNFVKLGNNVKISPKSVEFFLNEQT